MLFFISDDAPSWSSQENKCQFYVLKCFTLHVLLMHYTELVKKFETFLNIESLISNGKKYF